MNSDGLIITRLPAASAPAKPLKIMLPGTFQAVTIPTTPKGWYCTHAWPALTWRASGCIQAASSALVCLSTARGDSTSLPREKVGLRWPKSAVSASMISCSWLTRRPMARSISSQRRSAL
ncbi:hypothetical protein D9M71_497000 [compost metagenome]